MSDTATRAVTDPRMDMLGAFIVFVIVGGLLLFTFIKQPKCPKCNSKDIGLFTFHGKKVFTCHECGHKANEVDL